MANYMLDSTSTVMCLHAGQAQAAGSNPRVKAGGTPVLTKDSQAVCAPTGTGLNIINTQMRVKAT